MLDARLPARHCPHRRHPAKTHHSAEFTRARVPGRRRRCIFLHGRHRSILLRGRRTSSDTTALEALLLGASVSASAFRASGSIVLANCACRTDSRSCASVGKNVTPPLLPSERSGAPRDVKLECPDAADNSVELRAAHQTHLVGQTDGRAITTGWRAGRAAWRVERVGGG